MKRIEDQLTIQPRTFLRMTREDGGGSWVPAPRAQTLNQLKRHRLVRCRTGGKGETEVRLTTLGIKVADRLRTAAEANRHRCLASLRTRIDWLAIDVDALLGDLWRHRDLLDDEQHRALLRTLTTTAARVQLLFQEWIQRFVPPTMRRPRPH